MQVTKKWFTEIWNALFATAMPLVGTNVFLGAFTAINNRGLSTLLADLTLAPGTLATAVTVTSWNDPYYLDNGWLVSDANLKTIKGASSADDCTVIGFYLADAATAGNLLAFKLLPTPVHLTYPTSQLKIVVRLVLADDGTWDASIFFDGAAP